MQDFKCDCYSMYSQVCLGWSWISIHLLFSLFYFVFWLPYVKFLEVHARYLVQMELTYTMILYVYPGLYLLTLN